MLGLYDEYWGGALDPDTLEVDYDNLMGASRPLEFGGGMESSYYESFMTWLDSIDPDDNQWYELRAIPESGTLFLLSLGLIGVIALKRRTLKK